MSLGPNTLKMTKVGYHGPTQPIASTHLSSTCLRHNLHDGAMYTIRRRASASLQARLRNPSQTYFDMKQATRSRCVSHADFPPSVLRPKPRNYHGDFEAQITKP
jgi:hypothetical protein